MCSIFHDWKTTKDNLPKSMQRVLVVFKFGENERITIAEYIAPKTVLAEDYIDEFAIEDGFFEYDEDNDTNWAPSGWYESPLETETAPFIGDDVLFWARLPGLPRT